jgi:pre-mRNA-splicing helicase BRR2
LQAAVFCNRYPNIDLTHTVKNEDNLRAGTNVIVEIQLERYSVIFAVIVLCLTFIRDIQEGEEVAPVYATFYPKEKAEGWWVVLGDPKTNQLLGIKNILLD